MRSLKSGFLGCIVAGLLGTFAVVGCSASGDTGDFDDFATETNPTEDEDSTGTVLPPSSPDDEDDDSDRKNAGKKDAGKDAGKKDAGKDAGKPAPEPGDSCTTVDQKFKRTCGKCGSQEAICLANNVVSDYSACTGEAGTCMPGSTQACGNCGTQTCSNSCGWGTCTGQPQNSCSPGAVDYTGAGCSTAQTYRERVCSGTCSWGNYSSTCGAPNNPNKLTISGNVNGTVSGNYTLSAAKMAQRSPSYSCGTASPSSTTDHPYEIVEVRNTTTKTAKISTWVVGGTPSIDTVLTAYNTNLPPSTDAELTACAQTNDTCPSALSSVGCSSPWSGLTGTTAVTIAPGQVALLRFSSYYANSTSNTTTGNVTLTVRTDSLN